MSLMSINASQPKKRKLISLGLLLVLFASLIGFLRQIGIYFYTNQKLAQKEKELQSLEVKNKALQVRLEEVKKPEFLAEEAEKLLGVGNTEVREFIKPTDLPEPKIVYEPEKELTNFQKWWGLFK